MIRIAALEDLKGEGPFGLSIEGHELVGVRARDGVLRVYDGRCPHQGALLAEGEIEGTALVCRNHRQKFDLVSGRRVGGRSCLVACPAREEGGQLLVDLEPLARMDHTPAVASGTGGALRTLDDLPGPRRLPFVGSALDFDAERLHLMFEAWAKEHGTPYLMHLGPQPSVVFSDANIAAQLLRARPEGFRRPMNVEKVLEELGAAGVFSAEGRAWRPQRRLAMEALAPRHLRNFYPTMRRVGERLLRRWRLAAESGRVLDVNEELKRFTVDVTTELVFGHDLNTIEKGDEDILQRHLELLLPAANRRLSAVVPYWRYVRLPSDRRVDDALREVRTWLAELVEAARGRLQAEPERATRPSNFIEAMLAARDDEGRPFPEETIYGNALTMLLAGEDTTANTLAWAIHRLCDEPDAAAALGAEAATVLGEARVPDSLEQCERLLYAGAVAQESMRLHGVAPLLFLEANADSVVGDVAVPKGTTVVLLTRQPVVDARAFADPESFKPARWLGNEGGGAHDAAAHIPFGSGPRICPGRTLALLEMRLVLATLARSFDLVRVGASADVRERFAFTMYPDGLSVRLRRRA